MGHERVKKRKKEKEKTDKGNRNHGHRDDCKERVRPLVRKVIVHLLRKEREDRPKKVPCSESVRYQTQKEVERISLRNFRWSGYVRHMLWPANADDAYGP